MSKDELNKNETHTPDNSSWLERNVNLIVMGLCVVCAVTVIVASRIYDFLQPIEQG